MYWLIGSLFAHVWEVSSDTILHCFCIDDEIERRNGGRAKNSSDKLNNVLHRSEKDDSSYL